MCLRRYIGMMCKCCVPKKLSKTEKSEESSIISVRIAVILFIIMVM